jgi:cell division protein FtsB
MENNMLFFIITIAILLVATAYFGYRTWYLAGVIADIQEQDEDNAEYITLLETTNIYMYDRIKKSYDDMQQIDQLGAFESEDESGTTFQLLKEVITELKEQFDAETEEK